MIESINLQHIWRVLKKTWMIILAVAIVMGLLATIYTKLFVSETYTSTAKLFVTNVDVNNQDTGNVNRGDLDTAHALSKTCVELLYLRPVRNMVYEELDGNEEFKRALKKEGNIDFNALTPAYLSSCVNIQQIDEDVEILTITARTPSPTLSSYICNAYAKIASDTSENGYGYLRTIIRAGSYTTVEEAEPSNYASSPNLKRNAIVGALAGAVITFGIVFLISLFDNSVKDADDLKKRLNLPVLGEIPTFTSNSKM